jgi:hypothetical protein
MAKNNFNPLIIILALVIIFFLAKNAGLLSFITTCTSAEPNSVQGFYEVMTTKLGVTREETIPALRLMVNNITQDFVGSSHGTSTATYYLYELDNPICDDVIDVLLKNEESRLQAIYVAVVNRPGYDTQTTYYYYLNGSYYQLSGAPAVGQDYWKIVNGSYVAMSTPYVDPMPSLSLPGTVYTKYGDKSIDAYKINNAVYWCSASKTFLLKASNSQEFYNYAESMVTCKTIEQQETTQEETTTTTIITGSNLPGAGGTNNTRTITTTNAITISIILLAGFMVYYFGFKKNKLVAKKRKR